MKVLDRKEDLHSLEVARVELFMSLRYLCKIVISPRLWFIFSVAVWFLLGLVWVRLQLLRAIFVVQLH